MSVKPPSRASALLAAMKRPPAQVPTQKVPADEKLPDKDINQQTEPPPVEKESRPASSRRTNYKLVYFTDEDRALVLEKMVWVASQGIRPSDSLILRAALRVANPDQAFREALEAILRDDKRTRKARALAGR